MQSRLLGNCPARCRRILLASTALYHVRPWVVRTWSLKTVLADRAAFTLLSRRAYLYIYPFFFLQYVFSTVIFWGNSDSPTKPCREMAHQLGEHWCTACSRHSTNRDNPVESPVIRRYPLTLPRVGQTSWSRLFPRKCTSLSPHFLRRVDEQSPTPTPSSLPETQVSKNRGAWCGWLVCCRPNANPPKL